MARGMVVGEQIVSQAQTKEYDDNYERIFGVKKPTRGKFVYDKKLGKCVPIEEYVPEQEEGSYAIHAGIMVDRYMEGVAATDGTDIGSRRKRREYMKVNNLADADDFKNTWEQQRKEREAVFTDGGDHKTRRAQVERALHEALEGRRKR